MIKTKPYYSFQFYFHSGFEDDTDIRKHVIFETPYYPSIDAIWEYPVREIAKLGWELWCYVDIDSKKTVGPIAPGYKSEFIAAAHKEGTPAYDFTRCILAWMCEGMPVEDCEGFLSEEIKGYKFLPRSISFDWKSVEVVVERVQGDTSDE